MGPTSLEKLPVRRIDLRLTQSQMAPVETFRSQCGAREGREPTLHAAIERLIHAGLIQLGVVKPPASR